ncbi:MAG TPA: ATP-binding protein [Candidatus Binataceae bacterium]|nr:ATP-binding protein [Candidatus Binataceae bacterium]
MSTPSLDRRIRNGTLLLLVLVVLLGAFTLPRVYRLGGAIRQTLYRNYVSIEAAQHMHAALSRLELAERDGHASDALAPARAEFMHWMDIEDRDYTELGEPELAHSIRAGADRLFAELAAESPGARHDAEFTALHARLDSLTAMNQAAMFRADSRSAELGRRLTYQFAASLALVLIFGAAISWALGWSLSKPLIEVAERLRGVGQRRVQVRLGPQKFAELDAVAREFNHMAERLERFEKLNVDRLMYEMRKTEAIIESLEDGVVLLDSKGMVAHINEIAALIMGVEPKDALGSPFEDLSSNHPHYLRVRDALRNLRKAELASQRIEVQLHVRGRDHTYVLKPVPLHHDEATPLGTLLILQDVTYLRDQDRARANLIATLSHELRTPLTSLALSAELLRRDGTLTDPRQRELLEAILEECARMKALSDNLLNLARGELASITVQRERLDLRTIIEEVVRRFGLQAEEKHVRLTERLEPVPEISGDAVKLSWVVSNLIGNALRYTPEGGQIEVAARTIDSRVRLEVSDSGPGIAPEIREHIFERFAQYGRGGIEKGSAGLGLAIAKDIVAAHGGRIFVDSNSGAGSRFVVELPAGGTR